MLISLLDSARTSQAHRADVPLPELLSGLQTYEERASKDGPAWSPIVWESDKRSSRRAESVCAMVYDLDWDERADHDAAMAALGNQLETRGWVYAIHETFTARRWRLVLPLDKPVTPQEYAEIWEAGRAALGIDADPSGRDLARLFYLPTRPPGQIRDSGAGGTVLLAAEMLRNFTFSNPAKPQESANPSARVESESSPETISQKFLDLGPIRADVQAMRGGCRAELLELLDFKLRLKQGERENQLHRLVSSLVSVSPASRVWEVTGPLFRVAVEMMENFQDKGADYYLNRVHSSFERSVEVITRREAQTNAVREYFGSIDEEDWRAGLKALVDKDGSPRGYKALSSNIDIILEHHEAFRGHIRFNELTRRMEVLGGELKKYEGSYDVGLQQWLERSEFGIETDKTTCGAALLHHSKKHRYDPVRDYLEGLVWDGKPRIATALARYTNAEGNAKYIENISRKFFIAGAARTLEPGSKVDTVLVLQGDQGTKKTSFVQELSRGWYTTANSKVDDKDMRIQATEAWLVEMSELATVGRQSIEQLRGFITLQKDRIRIPYATYHEDFPRRCVFIGTTNSSQPLVDEDGNRRWWVVSCGQIDLTSLKRDVDQLWAEAVHCYREHVKEREAGVPEESMQHRWWLTLEEQEVSNLENSIYQQENPVEIDLQHWMSENHHNPAKYKQMTTSEVAKVILRINAETLHRDGTLNARIGKALLKLGWKKRHKGTKKGRYWAYDPPALDNNTKAD